MIAIKNTSYLTYLTVLGSLASLAFLESLVFLGSLGFSEPLFGLLLCFLSHDNLLGLNFGRYCNLYKNYISF